MVGCQDYDPHIPMKSYTEMVKEDGLWNFSMTRGITIDLDLGLRGVTYPVHVYGVYPYDEDGELKDGIQPIYAFFTKDGRYQANVELPSTYTHLYFACGGVGVPTLIEGRVVNGNVEFGGALTRANVNLYEYSITDNGTTLTPAQYSIKKWGVESTDPLYFSRFGEDKDNSNPNFVSTLYTLYPWSVNGAPLAGTDDEKTDGTPTLLGTPADSDKDYNHWFFYDNNGTIQRSNGDWITVSNLAQNCQENRPTINVNKAYISLAAHAINKIIITPTEDGTLTFDRIDNLNPAYIKYDVDYTDPNTTDVTGVQTNLAANSTLSLEAGNKYTFYRNSSNDNDKVLLTKISFVGTSSGTEYSLTFSYDAVNKGTNESFEYNSDAARTIFQGTDINTDDIKVTKELLRTRPGDVFTRIYSGTTYTYSYAFPTSGSDELFSIKVPALTKAVLKFYFDDTEKAARIKYKKDNGSTVTQDKPSPVSNYCELSVTAGLEPSIYHIYRPGSESHYLFAITLDYLGPNEDDTQTSHTRTSVVYKYDKNTNDKLPQFYQNLTNTLWHGLGSKSKAKEAEGEFFNTGYTSADQSKNNITVTKACEVFVTFLGEFNAYSSNCVGYYYYDKNSVPSSPDGLSKFLMFPNCSSNLYSNADKYKDHKVLTPLRNGDQVQLLYYKGDNYNESGCPAGYSKTFPEGTVIGWFLIYSGFNGWDTTNKSGADNMLDGKINLNVYNNNIEERRNDKNQSYKKYLSQVYYSDPIFNTTPIARVIQFTDTESGEIALCFEDSFDETVGYDDLTYDDLLLSIHSSPAGSLHNNSDQETVKETNGEVSYQELGTYLFEDILDGNNTDFDMNDVVIEYTRKYTLTYDATNSNTAHLTNVKETYKVINDGATYLDAFVVKTPFATSDIKKVIVKAYKEDGTTEFDNQEWTSFSSGENTFATSASSYQKPGYEVGIDGILSYVLFDDINKIAMNVVYTFEIQFKDGGISGGTVAEDTENNKYNLSNRTYSRSSYDPFVVVRDHPGANNRCEIHTPGKSFTAYGEDIFKNGAKAEGINNYWNVAKFDNKCLPFALDITATGFKVCENTIPINTVYSKFNSWAASNIDGGSQDADWYMTPGNGIASSYPTDR